MATITVWALWQVFHAARLADLVHMHQRFAKEEQAAGVRMSKTKESLAKRVALLERSRTELAAIHVFPSVWGQLIGAVSHLPSHACSSHLN